MLKTVRDAVNIRLLMDTLYLKLWEGMLTYTTDVHLMLNTVREAANINYYLIHYA